MPNYNILLSKTAQRQLDKLSYNIVSKLVAKIQSLSINPRPHGYTKLKGRAAYRVRHRNLFVVLLVFCYSIAFSQYPYDKKRDYHWLFGYGTFGTTFGGSDLHFDNLPPTATYIQQEISLDGANASICDTNGNFLFYTNGMYIADANHLIMPHGDSINPGFFFEYYNGFGYRMPQGVIILPLPGAPLTYYIIHNKYELYPLYFAVGVGSYYTIVDMSLNAGFGDVVQKNILYLPDSLDSGCLTATRHANGRDWWLVVPKFKSNKYYKYLLCPQGLIYAGEQYIGTPSQIPELGMAAFSPDGSKYCRFAGISLNTPFRLEIFDFDRCTGELSNYRNLWYVDSIYAPGLSISPNSRFMYVGRQLSIDQYDLQAPDIAASRQKVADYDFFVDPLFPQFGYTTFFMQQLAPDNKIYICTANGTRFLHVIDQPDSAGVACNVLQHSVQLPTFNSFSIPNFPNFRLGPVDGSICDSLGINIITGAPEFLKTPADMAIWPNPAQDYFNYKLTNHNFSENYHFRLFNPSGYLIRDWKFNGRQSVGHYNTEDVKEGIYFLSLVSENGEILKTMKLVIIR
jgi:mRNA-degrading endonuclease RelE of RelBE toxin-antitoxin system